MRRNRKFRQCLRVRYVPCVQRRVYFVTLGFVNNNEDLRSFIRVRLLNSNVRLNELLHCVLVFCDFPLSAPSRADNSPLALLTCPAGPSHSSCNPHNNQHLINYDRFQYCAFCSDFSKVYLHYYALYCSF